MRRPWDRKLLLAGLVSAVALLFAQQASAAFHLNKIREISGTNMNQEDSFIELQMYVPNEQFVSGHNLTFYTETGSPAGSPITLPAPEHTLNGGNQRTILIGDSQVPGRDITVDLGFFLDSSQPNNIVDNGAVCFAAIPVDCVAWGGSFTGSTELPDGATATGTTAQALSHLSSFKRDISPGCATLLEAGADTNSGADFDLVPRDPTPNATTPVEQACGGGGGGGITVKCGGLNATKQGTAGANVLVGTGGRDVMAGLGGRDTIRGLDGTDVLCGGGGRDRLIGGGGRDRLLGQAGRDTCKGGPKRDIARTCETRRTI